MMRAMRMIALACVCLCLASPVLAQKPRAQAPMAASEVQPGAVEDTIDRDRTLPYLAYTLGELHYLAYACDGPDVQTWRERLGG